MPLKSKRAQRTGGSGMSVTDNRRPVLVADRRYVAAQKALDLIETSALLEPEKLKDAAGVSVQQPGPGAPPVQAAPKGTV